MDVSVLLVAGQLRATTDMATLTAVDEDAEQEIASLYSALFYQHGGIGFPEIYRNPETVEEIERRVRGLGLRFAEQYDPGWRYRATRRIGIYDEVLNNALNQRFWQIQNLALRLQDDAYYALQLEQSALQRENPVFEAGTAAATRNAEIMVEMREISNSLPNFPPPVDTTPYEVLFEQDEMLADQQIASGVNGPDQSGRWLYRTAEELRESWVGDALSAGELARVLAEVDFDQEYVVAISVGEQSNASGEILISGLRYRAELNSYFVSVSVGVISEDCGENFSSSFPFALGVVEAWPDAELAGYSRSNFPAECGPVQSSPPTAN